MTSSEPSPTAAPALSPAPPLSRLRTISLFTAICIVIANMVGTAIFTSLGYQVGGLPSGFAIVCLWTVGGLCALAGALCYAELAAALPRSGGEYHFLSEVYHPAVGFLAGWISATVGFAAPIAATAIAFGNYGNYALPFLDPRPLSFLVVWICSAVHFTGLRRGSKFQDIFTVLKFLLIVAFIVAGFFAPHPQPVSFVPKPTDWGLLAGRSFAISLVFVMYAYSGWNASTYIVGEIRDPQRNVPRSVVVGTLLVLGLYVVLNAVFLRTTPMAEMQWAAEHDQPNVAALAAKHIFGEMGGRAMDGLICLGLISTISSMVWIGPRVTATMGEDLPALRFFGKKTRNGIPRVAIVLQLIIATVILCTSKFETIINATQLTLTLCSFFTVLGVIVLRIRRPDLPRPYRTWGYPVTPILFLVITLWMSVRLLQSSPKESLLGLGTTLAGLLVYFASRSHEHKRPTSLS